MRGLLHLLVTVSTLGLVLPACAQTADLERHLRNQYQGKTFLLRGFYSDDHLHYDSVGAVIGTSTPGDWTANGFVQVDGIRVSDQRLTITAKRLVAFSLGRTFQLRVDELKTDEKKVMPLLLEIQADLGQKDPSGKQSDVAMATIFLTAQDNFASLVPDYWKPCVPAGLLGRDPNCNFSPEILAIPGVTPSETATEATSGGLSYPSLSTVFEVGKGVSPPTVITQVDPEFSANARRAKFQGSMTLLLVINREGLPTNIHISSPLGGGLDAKAVHATQSWRFKPAEKDGQPVAVEIALEVDFHLF